MHDNRAQKLFQAFEDHICKVSGSGFFRNMVWEICGDPVADIVAGSLIGESVVPGVQITNGDTSWGNQHAPNLVGLGHDFVMKESSISEQLSRQLQIPSKPNPDPGCDCGNHEDIPWRCCPFAEIEIWKSEKEEAVQSNAKLPSIWKLKERLGCKLKPTSRIRLMRSYTMV
jgi:hypothetical protein